MPHDLQQCRIFCKTTFDRQGKRRRKPKTGILDHLCSLNFVVMKLMVYLSLEQLKWICREFEKSVYGQRLVQAIEQSCSGTSMADLPHPIFSVGLLPASEFKKVQTFTQFQWLTWRIYIDYKRNIPSIFLRFFLYMVSLKITIYVLYIHQS